MSDTTTAEYDTETGEIFDQQPTNEVGSSIPATTGGLVVRDAISRMQSGDVGVVSTVVGNDFSAKLKTLAAVTSAEPIMENLGTHLDLENIVVQEVEVTDRKTGEKSVAPRVILLDTSGKAVYGISPVLLRAVQTFIGVLGQPHTWPNGGVGVKVLREKSNNGFYFFNLKYDPTGVDPKPIKLDAKK